MDLTKKEKVGVLAATSIFSFQDEEHKRKENVGSSDDIAQIEIFGSRSSVWVHSQGKQLYHFPLLPPFSVGVNWSRKRIVLLEATSSFSE